MKEASGELNLTVVTIIAIAAVAGIGTFLYSKVKGTITNQWETIDKGGTSSTETYGDRRNWSNK